LANVYLSCPRQIGGEVKRFIVADALIFLKGATSQWVSLKFLLALNIIFVNLLELTKILSLFKSPNFFHGISRLGDCEPYDCGCFVNFTAFRRH